VQSRTNEPEKKVDIFQKTKEDYFKSKHLLIKASLEQTNQLLADRSINAAERISLLAAIGLA